MITRLIVKNSFCGKRATSCPVRLSKVSTTVATGPADAMALASPRGLLPSTVICLLPVQPIDANFRPHISACVFFKGWNIFCCCPRLDYNCLKLVLTNIGLSSSRNLSFVSYLLAQTKKKTTLPSSTERAMANKQTRIEHISHIFLRLTFVIYN